MFEVEVIPKPRERNERNSAPAGSDEGRRNESQPHWLALDLLQVAEVRANVENAVETEDSVGASKEAAMSDATSRGGLA